MTQMRRDPIIGQWVVVHTDDSWAPEQYPKENRRARDASTCQFCVGKEYLTPPEVDALRLDGSGPNAPGWRVRVVPNKFPALKIEGELNRQTLGVFDFSNGIGAHEVLIETPDHQKDLVDLSEEEICFVVEQYQRRLIDLTKDRRFKYVIIFKNYGETAGTTVEHAHSQIMALPMIPKYVAEELEGTKEYFKIHKRCVFCDILKQEEKDRKRIVVENDDFLVFCPFVPRYAFETWVVPKQHASQFSTLSQKERFSLAGVLKETLGRLKNCLFDPSYNYYLHVAPINVEEDSPTQGTEPFEKIYHWHIEIVPQLTQLTGFEWGAGFYVVHTDPCLAAKYLKRTT